jgi:hypothetical protein
VSHHTQYTFTLALSSHLFLFVILTHVTQRCPTTSFFFPPVIQTLSIIFMQV